MKHCKIWGSTTVIFKTPLFEIHRLKIKMNGYCSYHKHLHKYNMFYIEKGNLKLVYEDGPNKLEMFIKSGEKTTIEPNIYHSFEAMEDTIAYEIYYTFLEPNDIIRQNWGGINATDKSNK